MTTFVKRQNEFDAIQFTGGEESAEQVGKWLAENFDLAIMYQAHSNRNDGSPRGEIVIMNRHGQIYPGYWLTKDAWHGELTIFTEDEFNRMFVPLQEFDEAVEESFEEASLQYTPEGVEAAKVAEHVHSEAAERLTEINNGIIDSVPAGELVDKLEKFEFDGLFSIGGVLHGRRADNGDFVPVVLADGKPTMIVNVNGDYIRDETKYNEDTLTKVRKAIDTLTTRQPYMKAALIHDGVSTDDVITVLQNAGILFRERV